MILILWWRAYSNSGSCSSDYWKEYICLMMISSLWEKENLPCKKFFLNRYSSTLSCKLLLDCLLFCFEKGATTVHFRCCENYGRQKDCGSFWKSFKIDKLFLIIISGSSYMPNQFLIELKIIHPSLIIHSVSSIHFSVSFITKFESCFNAFYVFS